MSMINVDGLPDPVVRSLEAMVQSLKKQFVEPENLPAGEGLRRSAGAWADDAEELDKYLEETRCARKMERREPLT